MDFNRREISYHVIKCFKTHELWYDYIIQKLEENVNVVTDIVVTNRSKGGKDDLYEYVLKYMHEASNKCGDSVESAFVMYLSDLSKYKKMFVSVCYYAFYVQNTVVMDLFLLTSAQDRRLSSYALTTYVVGIDGISHLYTDVKPYSILECICRLPISIIQTYVDKYYVARSLGCPGTVYRYVMIHAINNGRRELVDLLCCENSEQVVSFGAYLRKDVMDFDSLLNNPNIYRSVPLELFMYIFQNASDTMKDKKDQFSDLHNCIIYAIKEDNFPILRYMINTHYHSYSFIDYIKLLTYCYGFQRVVSTNCMTYIINKCNETYGMYPTDAAGVKRSRDTINSTSILSYWRDSDVNDLISSAACRNNWDTLKILHPFLLPKLHIQRINDISLGLFYHQGQWDENIYEGEYPLIRSLIFLLYYGMPVSVLIEKFDRLYMKGLESILSWLIHYGVVTPDSIYEYIPRQFTPASEPHVTENTYLYKQADLISRCSYPYPNPTTCNLKPYDTTLPLQYPVIEYNSISVSMEHRRVCIRDMLHKDTITLVSIYLRYNPFVSCVWNNILSNVRCNIEELNLMQYKWLQFSDVLGFLKSWYAYNPTKYNMLRYVYFPSTFDISCNLSVLEFIVEKCPSLKVLSISIGLEQANRFDYIFYLINKLVHLHTLNITITNDIGITNYTMIECGHERRVINNTDTLTHYGIHNSCVENLAIHCIGKVGQHEMKSLYVYLPFIVQSFPNVITLDVRINHVTSYITKICLPLRLHYLEKLKYVYCQYTTPSSERYYIPPVTGNIYTEDMHLYDSNTRNAVISVDTYISSLPLDTHVDLSVVLSIYNKHFNLNMNLITL